MDATHHPSSHQQRWNVQYLPKVASRPILARTPAPPQVENDQSNHKTTKHTDWVAFVHSIRTQANPCKIHAPIVRQPQTVLAHEGIVKGLSQRVLKPQQSIGHEIPQPEPKENAAQLRAPNGVHPRFNLPVHNRPRGSSHTFPTFNPIMARHTMQHRAQTSSWMPNQSQMCSVLVQWKCVFFICIITKPTQYVQLLLQTWMTKVFSKLTKLTMNCWKPRGTNHK